MTIEESSNEELVTYPTRIQTLKDMCVRAGWDKLIPGFDSMRNRTEAELTKRGLA